MRALIDVAVIGAGPYGLSAAAHAVSAGLDVRVFGRPMRAWERHMPRGMFLKSEPAASDLADPRRVHTLDAYCRHEALPCAYGHPVPVETFTGYGRWFCERAVGDALEERDIAEVRATGDGFLLRTACEQQVRARAVVLAVGFVPFARRPPVLALLAPELCSHSCEHDRLSRFAGAEVAVVGAGQSALETAALLREAGRGPPCWPAPRNCAGTPSPSPGAARCAGSPRRTPAWAPDGGPGPGPSTPGSSATCPPAPATTRCAPRSAPPGPGG
ncbi:NAD(P)-binding domain-containing protein [Thermocatellispora tengchongensis]|uniref:NAD(P)-binding domain-containing protein n=1 Tax=Thermocatellispora tengchongensis TaxID=1073253 RepID=UPI003628C508